MWPVYVINMADSPERLDRVAAELDGAGIAWERIEAVDGRALGADEVARVYDEDRNRRHARYPLVRGEIGVYLSHMACWQALLDSDADGAIVLEDDFRVVGDLGGVVAALEGDAGAWDVAKLFSMKPVQWAAPTRSIGPELQIGQPTRVPSTMLGYAIRRTAAERLLQRSVPFFRPIDEDQKFHWEFGITVAMVDPAPIAIGAQDTKVGTIGAARRAANRADPRSWLARSLAGLRYQAGYRWGLIRSRIQRRGL
ncbi:MAG: glycosyltransferase family 25 protein [Rhodobacteraceae bacterium]|nr:glycosyltransferase family 25 protein [Paracoccaceae bacterium]